MNSLKDWGGRRLDRRCFIQGALSTLALLSLPCSAHGGFAALSPELSFGYLEPHPASFWQTLGGGLIQCQLCPRQCEVADGDRGNCGVRQNRQGKYYTLVYGNPCAVHVDPIEKKPFFHILPASTSFSIATAGCNFHCKFCQNWEISQARPEETYNFKLPPADIVAGARTAGSPSVAYTYVEPFIFYEYLLDTAHLAKKAGLLNVCHTAGYLNPKPLEALAEVLDAACIDLKAFDQLFYANLVGGDLDPVLNTLKTFRRRGVHLEIVNLLIPQFNDKPQTIAAMCKWIKDELGPLTPLHFSRFYPLYKMLDHVPTPVSTLEEARATALKAGLKYVYLGNIPGHDAENTYCHGCGKLLIARRGYQIGEMQVKDGKCAFCGVAIPGIWRRPAKA